MDTKPFDHLISHQRYFGRLEKSPAEVTAVLVYDREWYRDIVKKALCDYGVKEENIHSFDIWDEAARFIKAGNPKVDMLVSEETVGGENIAEYVGEIRLANRHMQVEAFQQRWKSENSEEYQKNPGLGEWYLKDVTKQFVATHPDRTRVVMVVDNPLHPEIRTALARGDVDVTTSKNIRETGIHIANALNQLFVPSSAQKKK